MSHNVLSAIKQLIAGTTPTIKIMVVVAIVSPDSVAVEADGERRVVAGSYALGTELLVNGNSVLGMAENDVKKYYIE